MDVEDVVATPASEKGMMEILDSSGDTKVIWDKSNRDEVEAAKKQFEHLIGKRFLAFKATGEDGRKGEQIYDFNPKHERIIMVPPMVGG